MSDSSIRARHVEPDRIEVEMLPETVSAGFEGGRAFLSPKEAERLIDALAEALEITRLRSRRVAAGRAVDRALADAGWR